MPFNSESMGRKSFESRVGRSSQNIHGADGERMGDGGLVDRWCRLLSVLPSRRWIVVGWLFQVCRPGSNEGETHRRRRLDLVDVEGEWSSATGLHAAVAKRTPQWRPAVSTISGQHALKPRQSCTFSHVLWLTPPCTLTILETPVGSRPAASHSYDVVSFRGAKYRLVLRRYHLVVDDLRKRVASLCAALLCSVCTRALTRFTRLSFIQTDDFICGHRTIPKRCSPCSRAQSADLFEAHLGR